MDLKGYKNNADVIFHKVFLARVPILSTYREDEIEITGIPMHQNDDKRTNSMLDLTTVMITINDMVEKHKNGFKISLVNYEDVIFIYNVIQDHLLAWRNRGMTSLNKVYNNIDDDLINLDKFANEIFNIHKVNIIDVSMVVKPAFTSSLADLFMSPTTPKKEVGVINYDEVTRTELAPEKVRKEKYDLNSLLS
jgi:hypothetical protein